MIAEISGAEMSGPSSRVRPKQGFVRALHTQGVIQGAFILAKATGGAEIAADSIEHLRRYIEMLFGVGTRQANHLTGGESTGGDSK